MARTYAVYIVASRSRTLYIGVTGDLERRLLEHSKGLVPGFTTRYRVFRLVYFELFTNIKDAIGREKELKSWRRDKKLRLIESLNATWQDLSQRLPDVYHSLKLQKADPSPRFPKTGIGFGMTTKK